MIPQYRITTDVKTWFTVINKRRRKRRIKTNKNKVARFFTKNRIAAPNRNSQEPKPSGSDRSWST